MAVKKEFGQIISLVFSNKIVSALFLMREVDLHQDQHEHRIVKNLDGPR
jgi:hypothetical protein